MKTKKAFTLVELLVTITILAILATVTIVSYSGIVKKAKASNANTIETEIIQYLVDETIDETKYTLYSYGEVTNELDNVVDFASNTTIYVSNHYGYTLATGSIDQNETYYVRYIVCEIFYLPKTNNIKIEMGEYYEQDLTYDVTNVFRLNEDFSINDDKVRIYITDITLNNSKYTGKLVITYDNVKSNGQDFNLDYVIVN